MHAAALDGGAHAAAVTASAPQGTGSTPDEQSLQRLTLCTAQPSSPVRNPVFFLVPLPLRKDCQLSCFSFCRRSMVWKRRLDL